ncbi:MAG: hypothetical protein Alis3KO_20660 [Aliiglaciecola sp.]
MYLDTSMRVLTIGDGDLTFSRSLVSHHGIENLTASVLDSEADLRAKYSENALGDLTEQKIDVVFNLDITDNKTIPASLLGQFDLVVFQFPLIPNFKSQSIFERTKHWGSNGLNRLLLHKFLKNSFTLLLAENGARLAYISSKDVKPYCDWDIENLHKSLPGVRFLGWQQFVLSDFPEYVVRNVDRDKDVKSTAAKSYVWSDKPEQNKSLTLNPSEKHKNNYCALCGNGPFSTDAIIQSHRQSRRHKKLQGYDDNWRRILLEQD